MQTQGQREGWWLEGGAGRGIGIAGKRIIRIVVSSERSWENRRFMGK